MFELLNLHILMSVLHRVGQQNLDVSLCVLVRLVLAQQLGLVGRLVGLQVLSVLSNVGPGPHAPEASDVDLQDAVDGIPPPGRGAENKHTPKMSEVKNRFTVSCFS